MCTKDQDAKHCSEAGADANEEPLFCWSSENQYPITGLGRGRLANEIWTSLLWFHICPHNSLLSGVSCLKCIPSLSSPTPYLHQASAPAVTWCVVGIKHSALWHHNLRNMTSQVSWFVVSVAHGQRILVIFSRLTYLVGHLEWQTVGKNSASGLSG